MGAKSGNFCLFSAYFGLFPPDLWMEYRIFISIVDISANLENIDINIDKVILKISISISISILENIDIDIDRAVLENIDKEILENIDIDIDKEISENIDIDKILNRLEFGISNRASWMGWIGNLCKHLFAVLREGRRLQE